MYRIIFAFTLLLFLADTASALTPIAPPICDIEGWLLATSSADARNVSEVSIEILYARNANYDHDCSKLVGKNYDAVLLNRPSFDVQAISLPFNFAASMIYYDSSQPRLDNATRTTSLIPIDNNDELPSKNHLRIFIKKLLSLVHFW